MKKLHFSVAAGALAMLLGCGSEQGSDSGTEQPADDSVAASSVSTQEPIEIAPGLTARILQKGSGEAVEAGQTAVVHYTGWLYDPASADKRGEKFDSSVDRGQHFRFALGAGRVIPGWDQGVVGMQVGEVRELTIEPEMAYGERGAGDVIPPDAKLVFEVELAGLE